MTPSILSSDYVARPYWWDAYTPDTGRADELPATVDVLVVGGGYAGVCCAAEIAEDGRDVVVLDAAELGGGASSRSGGQVTGGVNVQKKAAQASSGDPTPEGRQLLEDRLGDASRAFQWLRNVIAEEAIDCELKMNGRLTALWAPEHFAGWQSRLPQLNALTDSDAVMLTREQLREELGTSIYQGAAFIRHAGHLNPAALYGGLLRRALERGVRCWGGIKVQGVEPVNGSFLVHTTRGDIRCGELVLATNGSVGELDAPLSRSVVPVSSHMIATEPLPEDLLRSVIRHDRAVSETRRVVNHYRLSGDGRRLVFGGRARFVPTRPDTTARLLHRLMTRRYPQLTEAKITHSWGGNVSMTLDFMPHIGGRDGVYFVFGCNGSGVAMMSWLGSRLGVKIRERRADPVCAYDSRPLPRHALYRGNPWFMFALGSYYQLLDAIDYRRSTRTMGT
ncbi:NAD(P)/FAD-dependent oxidoreductase [Aureimonas mangrovi]|uniref:NAD(P)/FAD-dependent oxidoreductase n=1 Tax=Aureimonas mangrovi TaxID=2758041 RepID=UPI00163D52B1|nr:FAD-dependent oxidoreductase [Aureimonas mangrovi]